MTRSGNNRTGIGKGIAYLAILSLILLITASVGAISGLPQGILPGIDVYQGATYLTTVLSPAELTAGEAADTPVVPEELESATLNLTKPGAASLIPYTERGFDEPTVAAIAWWKEPGFGDNTTEYRNYLRATPEQKANYSEAKQIFFNFITAHLDPAIAESPQKEDLILFRGINPGVTKSVLTNGTYIEPAYPSTTYDVSISLILFGVRDDDGYKNVLVLQRDEGKKSLFIDDEEREFLLPRNTQWNVIKAVNVENLTITADFPLKSNNKTTDSISKVRLIYIKEVA